MALSDVGLPPLGNPGPAIDLFKLLQIKIDTGHLEKVSYAGVSLEITYIITPDHETSAVVVVSAPLLTVFIV